MSVAGREAKSVPELTEPAFVFHQLPGCGSKEMVEFLYANFAVVHDEPDAFGGTPVAGEPVRAVDPAWLSAAKLFLFRAHFQPGGIFIEREYPEFFTDSRFRVFLFVDDPLRLAAVTYLHVKRNGVEGVAASFGEFLRGRRNVMAFFLGATRENYRAVLNRYFFVGVNSDKATSLRKLYGALQKVVAGAGPTPNVERTGYQLQRWIAQPIDAAREVEVERLMGEVGPVARWIFRQRNGIDTKIWAAVRERLAAAD